MQKNWYIIYTKPKCEKKVAAVLTKKKIENLCPLNKRKIRQLRKTKLISEPLFPAYVFVNIDSNSLQLIKQIDNVVGFVYWKQHLAIIKDEEILAVKEFTDYNSEIKLEKTKVFANNLERRIDSASYTMDGRILSIKTKSLKLGIPSLGFTLVAEIADEKVIGREVYFGNKEMSLQ